MRGCGPSPLRRDPLGPGSGGSPQGWAGSGSRPRSGAPGPLPRGGPACAVRGAPVPGAGAPRATRPAPLASVVCGRSPGAPARGRGRRGPLFGHSSLGNSGPWPRTSAPSRARSSGLAARRPPPPVSPPAPPLAPLRPRSCGLGGLRSACPLRLARRRLRCGLPLVALPPLLRAVRRRARSPGPPLRRPLRAVLAAVLMGVGSVGLLRPGALAGPRSPRWGGAGAPSVWRCAPGLLRCGAARRLAACAGAPAGAACFSWGCCQSGASPLLPPRSPSPAGGGGGHRARRVASPPEGSAFRGPLWAPRPHPGVARMGLRLAGRLSENCQPPRRPRL